MKIPGFAERLNFCLDKEGFPPKNRGRIQLLAEMVGLTHRGASKWVNGESTPPHKKFAALAKKLNVNEQWLRTGEGEMDLSAEHLQDKSDSYLIDVNIYTTENILKEKKIIKTIKCNLPYKSNFFGIILDTEAMSPRFPSGTIVIFEEAMPKDGDFVLVNFNEYPSPIFRQLLKMGEVLYLNAHNPKFDRLILNDYRSIIGKLVQAIIRFD
ncbi:LexA family transcriptional regulator [Legionella erythra]|uniref:Putative phage repressor n=1 Tax=Legionella erythra TaxID=448 RepID=A0A0W0TUR4_LEGER|nr:LexA family transcriptional regulator [Legionella erythra]KTC99396.1 putative phage repressor [Legionella erythra]